MGPAQKLDYDEALINLCRVLDMFFVEEVAKMTKKLGPNLTNVDFINPENFPLLTDLIKKLY